MDYDKKQKWIAALLSGDYKQGNGTLKKVEAIFTDSGEYVMETQHCCLGVLCEVGNIGADIEPNVIRLKDSGNRSAFEDSEALDIGLPPDVQTTLIRLNDDKGMPFEFIAGYIEAMVPVTTYEQRGGEL